MVRLLPTQCANQHQSFNPYWRSFESRSCKHLRANLAVRITPPEKGTEQHGVRKGDYVEATRAGKVYRGWVSGGTVTQVSVSDIDWKRIGQFSARKVRILSRANGLLVKPS